MPLDFPSSPTNGQVYGNYYYNSARGAWNALLPAATPNFFTNATLNTSTLIDATATSSLTSTTPLKVIGLSGQTANLQEWKDSSSTVAYVTSAGSFKVADLSIFTTRYGNSMLSVSTGVQTNVGVTVRGSGTQSANLQEWQNSSGTILSYVDSAGNINFSGSGSFVQSSTGRALFVTNAAATTPLTVKAAASQTADLQQWQSSTGAVLSEINSAGELQVPRIGVGATMPTTTRLMSTASDPAEVPIIARGAVSQTAALQSWQDSASNVLSYMDNTGKLFAQDLSLTKNTAHIEIGGVSGTANTPYIDFHSSAALSDYNVRIIADGGTASNASGNLTIQAAQLNLPTKTYMPGAIVQVAEVRAAAGDKSASSSAVDIISTTFTTKLASSKLLLMWHSGQVSMSGPQVNMMIYFTIDGTDISDFTTNHYFYGDNNTGLFRHVVTIPIMSGALSIGAHTVKVRGQAYNGTATYDFQSSSSPERRSRLVIMEVAQ